MIPIKSETSKNTADQLLALEVFCEALASTRPEDLGHALTTQVRELTGAQTVQVMMHGDSPDTHVMLDSSPARRANLLPAGLLGSCCPACRAEVPVHTRDFPPNDPLGDALVAASVTTWMRVPLYLGEELTGTILLFNLPEHHRLEEVRHTLGTLAPMMAIALRNALSRERIEVQARLLEEQARGLESRVAEQTADLLQINRALNLEIKQHQQTEHELRIAKDAAEAANRAKSAFLSSMSHELRTPLNPIIGFTELLMDAPNLSDEQRLWMELVHQRGKDLLGLIGTVLDLCKIEARRIELQPSEISLHDTLSEIVRSFTPLAKKKGLRLTCSVTPDVPQSGLVDGLRLRQILLNLVNNAIKFTPTGRIEVRAEVGDRTTHESPCTSDSCSILFSVKDTGIGIAADRQEAIFESFTQADPVHAVDYGGGTGLGLTIVKNLVELMGGRIWVESAPGKGSVFRFVLPIGRALAEKSSESQEQTKPPNMLQHPRHALVVDDDPASLRIAETVLRKARYEVAIARDGEQALKMMQSFDFDIVLLDVQMPVMDGIETIGRIRALEVGSGKHVPVIALTAYALAGDRERFLQAGMDDYLSKPVYPDKLIETVDQWIHGTKSAL
jgi:signal transduction histidine kinase/ActR/RegA family two-component response regulator